MPMGARGDLWAPCMVTLAAPWVSDRGGFERPNMGAAWISAYTVAVASAAAGLLEDQTRHRLLAPHDPSLFRIHSPSLPFPSPSFSLSFSRSLSLSRSLSPPLHLFPALRPLRLSRLILALPPELSTLISHCPLSTYPHGRTAGPHPFISGVLTIAFLDPTHGFPGPQPFLSWPAAIDLLDVSPCFPAPQAFIFCPQPLVS